VTVTFTTSIKTLIWISTAATIFVIFAVIRRITITAIPSIAITIIVAVRVIMLTAFGIATVKVIGFILNGAIFAVLFVAAAFVFVGAN
jgi:hypothetical protein